MDHRIQNNKMIYESMRKQKEADAEKSFSGTNGNMVLSAISKLPDVYSKNDAEECLKSIQSVTKILRAVGEYEKRLSAIIQLEIEAFRKIAQFTDCGGDISGIKNVEKRYKDAVSLYVNLSKEEREEIESSFGVQGYGFVSYVAKLSRDKDEQTYCELLESKIKKISDEYDIEGYASVDFLNESKTFPKTKTQARIYDAMKNRAKDSLLCKGAIGCGQGMYVNPSVASDDEIRKAIENRCKSVLSDLAKINKLVYLRSASSFPDCEEFTVVMEIINRFRKELCKEVHR